MAQVSVLANVFHSQQPADLCILVVKGATGPFSDPKFDNAIPELEQANGTVCYLVSTDWTHLVRAIQVSLVSNCSCQQLT